MLQPKLLSCKRNIKVNIRRNNEEPPRSAPHLSTRLPSATKTVGEYQVKPQVRAPYKKICKKFWEG